MLNSVGSSTDRPRYEAALREALAPVKPQMCEDNQRRAETNPLRVLDSRTRPTKILSTACRKSPITSTRLRSAHFAAVLAALDACGVQYKVNPRLVRGLDYYTRTTFEFTHGGLGAQNALLGGGRYDGLSEMLGWTEGSWHRLRHRPRPPDSDVAGEQAESAPPLADAYIAPLGESLNAAPRWRWPANCAAPASLSNSATARSA